MRAYLKAGVFCLALLVAGVLVSPSAQFQIQRGAGAVGQFIVFALGTQLVEESANVLAQRNGTNAQTMRWYHTYTSASNYERISLEVLSANIARLNYGQATGAGTARGFRIDNAGTAVLSFGTNQTMTAGAPLFFSADNTHDIGASGATRPRTVYAGTSIVSPAYTVGAVAGCTGTPTVVTNGIATTCSSPEENPLALARAEIAALRQEVEALKALLVTR